MNNYNDEVDEFLNFVFDNKEKEELDGGNDDDNNNDDDYDMTKKNDYVDNSTSKLRSGGWVIVEASAFKATTVASIKLRHDSNKIFYEEKQVKDGEYLNKNIFITSRGDNC
ncbi:hypothetical protein Glove_365g107 [Diversispora epigaea]|uniref:Uncharacterized protein n=1 Tax=Diversispora epigaea TaxID=1348612 RepID=A0A397H8P7_9GLOM|nr:hypothetical protein Glove_365g107 [Diversispora epigaea]